MLWENIEKACFIVLRAQKRASLQDPGLLFSPNNPGLCKVFIFSTLCGDTTWDKKQPGVMQRGPKPLITL